MHNLDIGCLKILQHGIFSCIIPYSNIVYDFIKQIANKLCSHLLFTIVSPNVHSY